ncbi:PAS domain-containing protein [Patescibacteria group bacterium]|nr:PAS domain-containing protein [Patescibacteria group bacterium]MBU1672850.1 PAS domain-containing protein [Patescibacteria group bacterium]MBU1963729.1 PAS domain-containing protein [Patescibacteria group bacterium]
MQKKKDLVNWAKEIDASLIVIDKNNIIIEMNDKAKEIFNEKKNKLIGDKVFKCHPPFALKRIKALIKKREPDVYTTQTKTQKTLVYHTPWYINGKYMGFIELEVPIRRDMRNILRGDFGYKEY